MKEKIGKISAQKSKLGPSGYLMIAALGILFIVLIGYFSYSTVLRALVQSEADSIKSIASANALSLKAGFEDKETLIESLYGDDFPDMAALEQAMDKVFCDKDFYREHDYRYLPEEKREVCQRAAENPGEVISGPTYYQNGGYYVFYMTKAISIDGRIAGVLQFEWNLDRIFRESGMLSNLEINNNGYCIVRNKEGKIIMSREGGKEDIRPETDTDFAYLTKDLPRAERTWSYTVEKGVPMRREELVAYASAAFEDEVFTVCVGEDYAMLVKPLERLLLYLTLLGGALLVWLLGALWFYMQGKKQEEALKLELLHEKEMNEVGKTLEKQEALMQIYNRDKELTSLWGALAHEFNNQMTPILLYAELFKNNKSVAALLPEETEELYQSAAQCSQLSRQMLEFSRAGRAERKKTRFNASAEVRLSLRMIQRILPQNIRLEASVSKKDYYMLGQTGMLGQILLNLSNNAIHAMKDQEQGILQIAFGEKREEPGVLCLVVADNGKGIPKELRRHIFEPFFTTKPETEGTGIGLTVVARLLQENGGSISASSEEGKGSRFVAELPAAAEDQEEDAKAGK